MSNQTASEVLHVALLLILASTFVLASKKDGCSILQPLWGCGVLTPELNQCLATGTTYDIRVLRNGVPEYGVPSLVALDVPEIQLTDKDGKKAFLIKCKLYGGDSSVVTNFTSVTGVGFEYDIKLQMKLACEKYTMAAGFLDVKDKNSGSFTLLMKNYKARFNHTVRVDTSCGETYLDWTTSVCKSVTADSSEANFSGLSAASKAEVDQKALKQVLLQGFTPVQEKLILKYLRVLYTTLFPPASSFAPPNSTSSRVPYCLQRRKTC